MKKSCTGRATLPQPVEVGSAGGEEREFGVRMILPGREELAEASEWGDPCLVCQDGGGQCFLEVRATTLRIAMSGSLWSRISW